MQIWKQLSVQHGNGIKVIQMDIRMCEGGSGLLFRYSVFTNSPFSQIMHDIHAQSILHRKLKGCSYNF